MTPQMETQRRVGRPKIVILMKPFLALLYFDTGIVLVE